MKVRSLSIMIFCLVISFSNICLANPEIKNLRKMWFSSTSVVIYETRADALTSFFTMVYLGRKLKIANYDFYSADYEVIRPKFQKLPVKLFKVKYLHKKNKKLYSGYIFDSDFYKNGTVLKQQIVFAENLASFIDEKKAKKRPAKKTTQKVASNKTKSNYSSTLDPEHSLEELEKELEELAQKVKYDNWSSSDDPESLNLPDESLRYSYVTHLNLVNKIRRSLGLPEIESVINKAEKPYSWLDEN